MAEVVITAPEYYSRNSVELLSRIGSVEAAWFTAPQLLYAVRDCRVLCIRVETQVGAELIAAAPELQVVLSGTTGINHIDIEALRARQIPLYHLHGEHTRPTAEHTMALLLALARNLKPADAAIRRGEWQRERFIGRELKGQRLGIVGIGKIGSEVCSLATAFGMEVLAYDPYLDSTQINERGAQKADTLERLCAEVDALTLHCPLTDETRKIINADLLSRLPLGALLVNAARAGIVDEEALIAEIRQGRLSAAIDVFDPEPPGRSSELVRVADEFSGLMLTPHLGASTVQAVERASTSLAERALQYLEIS